MAMTVTDTDRGMGAIGRVVNAARDRDVKVGVQSESGQLVNVATYNEYGTATIPARPFIRSAIDENAADIGKAAAMLGGRVLDAEINKEQALGSLGLFAQRKIVEKIRSNIPPPNAPSTVNAKGSSATLIDSGQLRQSIRHKVVDRGAP